MKSVTGKVFALFFFFGWIMLCLTGQAMSQDDAEHLQTGWPLYKIRSQAFEQAPVRASLQPDLPLQDQDYLSHQQQLAKGLFYSENTMLRLLGRHGDYVTITPDKKAIGYTATGQTASYGTINQLEYPNRLLLYDAATGHLKSITLSFSPKDIFRFNAEGNLLNEPSSQSTLWDRPSFEKKITAIGQKLLQDNHIHERIVFSIEPSTKIVNAYASENFNTVVISKGMLNYISSDDELAAVLAHEIAHIILRHSAVQPRETPDILLQRLIGLPVEPHQDLVELNKEQQKEFDADRFGLIMLTKSGYDPNAMLSILSKGSSDGSYPWRDHPMGTQRLAVLEQQIHTLQRKTQGVTSAPPSPSSIAPEKAREEVLQHLSLGLELAAAANTFPKQDPEYQIHLDALNARQIQPGKILVLHTARKDSHPVYSVIYPQARAYLSYNPDGSRSASAMCNQAHYPRTCYILPEVHTQPPYLQFQFSPENGFVFSKTGDYLSTVRYTMLSNSISSKP